jgi:hypothetical protein
MVARQARQIVTGIQAYALGVPVKIQKASKAKLIANRPTADQKRIERIFGDIDNLQGKKGAPGRSTGNPGALLWALDW